MKYAICNEVYVDWPFPKAFAHARALGYEGIEIAPFTIDTDVRRVSNDSRKRIRSTADAAGIEIIGLHWLLAKTEGLHLTHNDPKVRNDTAEYLGDLAKFCRDLGGKIMVFGSPPQRNLDDGVSDAEGFDRAVEVFKNLAPTLEKCDVTLALEPLGPEEGNFMLTAESAIAIAKDVGSPNVKLHLDVKAMSTESAPIPTIIEDSKEWLVHFHANDPNRLGPGMGEVDFLPIFEALNRIGYRGWTSVEVFDYAPGVDILTGDSIRYMQKISSMLSNHHSQEGKTDGSQH